MNRGAWTLTCFVMVLGLLSCQSAGAQPGGESPEPGSDETAEAAEPEAEETAAAARTGLYTVEQAERGEQTYDDTCSFCHATSQFSGTTFMRSWGGSPVDQLYSLIASTMPYDAPGSLSTQQYVDVVAYILELNDLPAGDDELPTDPDALSEIRIEEPAE
ncbi:MAG: c-type cytochrome [Gemmatimonadota bacterium]